MKLKSAFPLLAAVFVCCLPALAQDTAAPQNTSRPPSALRPTTMKAEAVLDRYIQVTGGATSYNRLKSTYSKAKISLTAQNLNGTVEIYQKSPSKYYTSQEFAQIGKSEQGFDGKTAWSRDAFTGLRVLSGKELDQTRQQAQFNSTVNWRQIYSGAQMKGIRQVEGKDAYVVILTPKFGAPATQYYDVQTGLLVRQDQVIDSRQGRIPTENYLSDYRSVDGVKVPFKLRTRLAATEITTDILQYKNNVAIPDTRFVKPAK